MEEEGYEEAVEAEEEESLEEEVGDDDEVSGKSEEDDDFYENLALKWDEDFLEKISRDLCEAVERDREARKPRDKQQEDGLKRTGMGDEAPGGADFQGASKATHPVITTCTIDFAARAIKEIFPPEGPVKTSIIGQVTKGRLERADRIRRHMNFQLTKEISEYRAELERLLTQLPMGGSQYLKWYWDGRLNRARADFVPIDNVFLPFNASSLYTADRVTHWQVITDMEYQRRVKTGLYRDVEIPNATDQTETSASERANNKIEGKTDQAMQGDDDTKEIYEIYTYLEGDDPKADYSYGPCPYIVNVDVLERKVLSVYRNWEPEDDTYKAVEWIVEFGFIPWRGAYCVGLPHLIGGLSAAATGALRALLDSAHINNAPTALKIKSGRVSGQSITPSIGQINEIEGGPGIDDVRKIAMPMPFNPPSPVLFQLLGSLDELARGVVRTVLEDQSGSGTEVPVGTQLSRVENGMVVFSAIHSRLHAAQRKCLEILFRLNRQHLDDQTVYDEFGEVLVKREDYEGSLDVMPVSDPHIFSESQRFAQNQGLVQMAAANPELYNHMAVHRRVLETMRIPNVDEILVTPPQPTPQNPVSENVQMMMGKHAFAFPDQDHLAHIEVLLKCLEDPNYGASALIAPAFIPAALEHLKQHLAFWYAAEMLKIADEASGLDFSEIPYAIEGLGRELDQTMAQASALFHAQSQEALQGIPEVVQKAMMLIQQLQPQGMQDPNMLVAQAAMKDAETRAQKIQMESGIKQADQQIATQKLQVDAGLKEKQIAADIAKNTQDNQVDLQIAGLKEVSTVINSANQQSKKPE